MKTLLRKSFLIACAALTIGAAPSDCRKPDIQTLLEKITKQNFFSPNGLWVSQKSEAATFQWLGVAWEAPVGGMLLALSCAGEPIARLNIGAVTKLTDFDANPGLKSAVIAEFIAGTGTGYELRRVGIYRLEKGRIREVWSHDTYVDLFMLQSADGTHTEYTVDVSADGKRISVAGTTETYPAESKGKSAGGPILKKLPVKSYCWDGKEKYRPCRK